MIIDLAKLAIQAFEGAPSWALYMGPLSMLICAGLLALAYERSRRRTYEAVLKHIPAGTLLVDKTRYRKELIIVHLPRSVAQLPYVRSSGSDRRSAN
jgi:hypothetical protein